MENKKKLNLIVVEEIFNENKTVSGFYGIVDAMKARRRV
jgi:hypothetical protein